eukprot:11953657-Heterocapsa_arctica.AAC.1
MSRTARAESAYFQNWASRMFRTSFPAFSELDFPHFQNWKCRFFRTATRFSGRAFSELDFRIFKTVKADCSELAFQTLKLKT